MRGGKRIGSGRRVGSKDKGQRDRKKRIPQPNEKQIQKYKDTGKPLHLIINRYLSKGNKKLYKDLYVQHDDPLEALKALLDDMVVRYNYARIAEMEGTEAARKLALDTAEEFKKQNKLKEAANLIDKVTKMPRLSSSVTTLASEIRQITQLIHTIESGSGQGKKNIFLIFNNPKLAKQAENELFKVPKDVIDIEAVHEEE